MDNILRKSSHLANLVKKEGTKLISILSNYESYETALDEITRTLKCLNNIDAEKKYLNINTLNSVSSFLPSNLPLYSLILFAIVPSFAANKLFVRSPVLMRRVLEKIIKTLKINNIFPDIKVIELGREIFLKGYVETSDIVLFTGRYKNATRVLKKCPSSLFIYNGAGINPIIITSSADLDLAVDKTLKTRVFNSGQDCAGPDSIIVHSRIKNKFLEKLIMKLSRLKIGKYSDQDVRIGKIINPEHLNFVSSVFKKYRQFIVYGGTVDFKRSIVHPTVMIAPLKEIQNYIEFFCPTFFVSIYDSHKDLDLYFQNSHYKDFAMYVSLFGKTKYIEKIPNSVILKEKNILDVEEGNKPYGGYGPKANFVHYSGKFYYRPILISKEIYLWQKLKREL